MNEIKIENQYITDVEVGIHEHYNVVRLKIYFGRDRKCPNGHFEALNIKPEWFYELIGKLCHTFDVDNLFKLRGMVVRIKDDGANNIALGHIIEDKWVSVRDFENDRVVEE